MSDVTPMVVSAKVREENLDGLRDLIKKAARKAAKLGLVPLTMSEGAPEKVTEKVRDMYGEPTGEMRTRLVIPVTLAGALPVLSGWRLLGTLTREDGGVILSLVPGEQLDESFRDETRAGLCDHCGTIRYRKAVYVVGHESGEVTRVGSSCIRDFLPGFSTPEAILRGCAEIASLFARFSELADEDRGWNPRQGEETDDLELYLSVVAVCIERDGWAARSANLDRTTAGDASTWLHGERWLTREALAAHKEWKRDRPMTDEAKATAAATIAYWTERLEGAASLSDYEHNLRVILRSGYVRSRTRGFAASMVSGYLREMAKLELAKREAEAKLNEWRSESVKDRIEFDGVVARSRYLGSGEFGERWLNEFRDAEGRTLVWFTSRGEEEGASVSVRATIKEKSEYNGTKQTVLTRAVVTAKVAVAA